MEIKKRTTVPQRDAERERSFWGSSEMTVRQMTPDEHKRHFVDNKPYTDDNGMIWDAKAGVRSRIAAADESRRRKKRQYLSD